MACASNRLTVGLRIGFALLVLCSLFSVAAAQTCVQPLAGLVSWWPGDNNADDIQNGNNGTLQGGVTFAPGEVDQAFNFDGSTGFVQVPQNSLWEFGSDDFTVDFWINFRTPNTSETLDSPDVFDIIGADEGEGGTNKWLVRFGGGVLTFHVNDDGTGPGSLFLAQAPFSPNLNQWYFIAVTRSGNTFTTYIDGQAAATETMAVTIPFISAPLTWGLVEAGRFLDGLMDEIEIYNRALSAAEIEAIFTAGSAGKCKGVPLTPLAAQADLSVGPQAADDTFALQATFILGDGSNSIDPLTEEVTVQVGTSALTIPAGAFHRTSTGAFQFAGVIEGVTLQVTITPLTRATFEVFAHGEGAALTGIAVPVLVGLTIGDDHGRTTLPIAEVSARTPPPQR
jgi:Concanavalin A-like lectin/glucanases superfamily